MGLSFNAVNTSFNADAFVSIIGERKLLPLLFRRN